MPLARLARLPPPLRRRSGLPGLLLALSRPIAAALTDDFVAFESVVWSGDLYSRLIANCRDAGVVLPSDDGEAREVVKRLLMRDVLAKIAPYPSPFEDVFRRAFPSVHRFARWINLANHKDLIRTLQRLESWLVIENVAPRLVGRLPIVTLHDAIYARVRDLPAVAEAFEETFAELGLRMRVKMESTVFGSRTGPLPLPQEKNRSAT
jgi:hypothetical protein